MQVQQFRPDARSRGGAVSNRLSLCGWNPCNAVSASYCNSEPGANTTNIQAKRWVSGLSTDYDFGQSLFFVFNPNGAKQTLGFIQGNRIKPFAASGPIERYPLTHHLGCNDIGLGTGRCSSSSVPHQHVKTDVLLN